MGKTLTGLLSAALILGAVGAPAASAAPVGDGKAEEQEHRFVDWGTVDVERLSKALMKRGEIDKETTPEEVEKAVKRYVEKRKIPHGIDTSTKWGSKAEKGLKSVQSKNIKKANRKGNWSDRMYNRAHKDNIVLALIEFPDYQHNSIEQEEGSLYTKDFSPEHYEKMLFNPKGYTTPEGLDLMTMAEYYLKQSGGTWTVDGTVTPWIQAEQDAAYYGGNNQYHNDKAPRELVHETLEQVGKAVQGNEERYDQRDPYDLDGDGNVMEPDGLLDNLMLVHSGIGEEAGGGELGEDAIWSHRWTLKQPTEIPGTSLKAYDYMIQPEDGAVGVFAHEYGHNLGLPDLYDTIRSGLGSPVGSWSLMSAGSWNGKILGTEPTGFDPWSKMYLQATFGGKWITPVEVDYEDIQGKQQVFLNQASSLNPRRTVLKVNLPDVEKEPPTQPQYGDHAYFSDYGDDLNTKMTSGEIDLTGADSAALSFDSWRQIETGYDYLYIHVIDTATGEKTQLKAYDDTTGGEWIKEELDLSDFVGKKIQLQFNYVTDGGLAMDGFYVDNIAVEADGKTVFEDDAEGEPKFQLEGFKHFDGSGEMFPSYYLVEWRTHHGTDKGLAHLRRGSSFITYDPGMLVWHYDGRYAKGADNHTGNHPGEGFFGVVDAHQRVHYWNNDPDSPATDRYQVLDAAFGFNETSGVDIENYYTYGDMHYPSLPGIPVFYDGNDYSMPGAEDVGKILPQLGLQFELKKELRKGKSALIEVSKR
ncbi:immune inhibitor A domain-containing protein [Melghirimyces profundicolus]|nr:immune inhibitor A domain-containing protein [Melghirimyces profundicolus]